MKLNKKKSTIRNVKFGKNVTVIEPVNLYDCIIGDNCFIGPFVEIQKNVKIGKNTRIQSHSFICSNVKIGKDCFVLDFGNLEILLFCNHRVVVVVATSGA